MEIEKNTVPVPLMKTQTCRARRVGNGTEEGARKAKGGQAGRCGCQTEHLPPPLCTPHTLARPVTSAKNGSCEGDVPGRQRRPSQPGLGWAQRGHETLLPQEPASPECHGR